MRETLHPKGDEATHILEPRAAGMFNNQLKAWQKKLTRLTSAAVGQSGLMSLYDGERLDNMYKDSFDLTNSL